jgi:aspergillopepsin I
MFFLISALTFLLLATHALAAPTSEIQKKGFVSPVHRYIPSYAKISEGTGAVESLFDGGGWILPVLIGGQQLWLNLDTGSSDL